MVDFDFGLSFGPQLLLRFRFWFGVWLRFQFWSKTFGLFSVSFSNLVPKIVRIRSRFRIRLYWRAISIFIFCFSIFNFQSELINTKLKKDPTNVAVERSFGQLKYMKKLIQSFQTRCFFILHSKDKYELNYGRFPSRLRKYFGNTDRGSSLAKRSRVEDSLTDYSTLQRHMKLSFLYGPNTNHTCPMVPWSTKPDYYTRR